MKKKRKRILSISYDEALLYTREAMLKRSGYEVVSAYGFTAGIEKLASREVQEFDLIVLGHSIPGEDKNAIVAAIRNASNAPILSIRRHGYEPLPGSNFSVDAVDGPEILLEAVERALKVNVIKQRMMEVQTAGSPLPQSLNKYLKLADAVLAKKPKKKS